MEAPSSTEASPARPGGIAAGLAVVAVAALIWAVAQASFELRASGSLQKWSGLALAASVLAAGLSAALLIRVLRGRESAEAHCREAGFVAGGAYLRLLVYGAVAALAVAGASRGEIAPQRLVFMACLLLGVHAGCLLPGPFSLVGSLVRLGESRPSRLVDLVAGNLLLTVVLLEILLQVVSGVGLLPPWLQPRGDGFALKLSVERLGFAPNSLGYMDTEWSETKPPGTLRVAALGDSFAVAIVPNRLGCYTVLEELLKAERGKGDRPPVEVLNLGISGTCPNDYAQALEVDGLRFEPDLVLVGLYLGNDVQVCDEVPGVFSRERLYIYQLVRRGPVVLRERMKSRQEVAGAADPYAAYLEDPPREVPARSEDAFLRIARKHSKAFRRALNPEREVAWAATFDYLERIHRLATLADSPLVIALFPTRLQVEPGLRARVGLTDDDFDSELPASRIREWAAPRSVRVFDLSDDLRVAQANQGDVYHVQDEHWNIRGNQVAAEAMARELAPLLETLGKPR